MEISVSAIQKHDIVDLATPVTRTDGDRCLKPEVTD